MTVLDSKWLDDLDEPTRVVVKALADERWDYRTVDGIAEESGLSVADVDRVLGARAELVRESSVPDARGRTLYTLRSRRNLSTDFLRRLRMFLSKTI